MPEWISLGIAISSLLAWAGAELHSIHDGPRRRTVILAGLAMLSGTINVYVATVPAVYACGVIAAVAASITLARSI